MEKVSIIIPIYKTDLTSDEIMSFVQCLKVLGNYPIVLAQPESVDFSAFISTYKGITVETFPDRYFKSVSCYNQLMLSPLFYERFIQSEYILIYQLDAFVFKDALIEWCNKGYDYIGAPWIATPRNAFFPRFNRLFKKDNSREQIFFKTGNGGFSLRKTTSFFRIAMANENLIWQILQDENKVFKMEDVFWSLKAPELDPDFRIPDYQEAVAFAMDRKPNLAMKINQGKLPFGCHGFNKPKVYKFWQPILSTAYNK